MNKLYTISVAKTEKDTKRSGTLYYNIFVESAEGIWVHFEEKSVSKLTRDEQLAHIDTLISIMAIPGNQEDDVGMSFNKTRAVPLTDRVAIGVIASVKELHTLRLSPDNTIFEASKTDPDERRFVQKDFISTVERLFKTYSKFDTPEDIYNVQHNMAVKPKQRVKNITRQNGVTTL